MAERKFYIEATARNFSTRHETSKVSRTATESMEVRMFTKVADLHVSMFGDNQIVISALPHGSGITDLHPTTLYAGPIKDLLTHEGRGAIVREFAEQALRKQAKG